MTDDEADKTKKKSKSILENLNNIKNAIKNKDDVLPANDFFELLGTQVKLIGQMEQLQLC